MSHDKEEVVLRTIHKLDSQLQSFISRNRGAWFEPHVNSLHLECKKVMTIIRNGPPSSDQNADRMSTVSTNSQDQSSYTPLTRKPRAPRALEENPSTLPSLPHTSASTTGKDGLRIKNPNVRDPNGRPHLAFGSIIDSQQSNPPQRKAPAPASLPALSAGLEKGRRKPIAQSSAHDPSPARARSELPHKSAGKENSPVPLGRVAATAPKADKASDLPSSSTSSTSSSSSSSPPSSSTVVAGPIGSAATTTPASNIDAVGGAPPQAGGQGTHRVLTEKEHAPASVTASKSEASTTPPSKPVVSVSSKANVTTSVKSKTTSETSPKTTPPGHAASSLTHVTPTTSAVSGGDVSVPVTTTSGPVPATAPTAAAPSGDLVPASATVPPSGGAAAAGSSPAEKSSLASHGPSLSLLVVDNTGASPAPTATSGKAPDSTTSASASPAPSVRSAPAAEEAVAPEAACSPRAAAARREVSLSDAVHALMRKHSIVEDGATPLSPSGRSHSVLDGDAAGLRSQRSPAAGQHKSKLNSPLAGARGFPSSRTNGNDEGVAPVSGAAADPAEDKPRLGSGAPRRASMPGLHSLGRKGRKGSVTSEILSLAGVFLDTSAGDGEQPEQKKIVLPKHSKEDWIRAMNELPEEEDEEEAEKPAAKVVNGEAAEK